MKCRYEKKNDHDFQNDAEVRIKYVLEGVKQERYFCIAHFLMEFQEFWYGDYDYKPLEVKFLFSEDTEDPDQETDEFDPVELDLKALFYAVGQLDDKGSLSPMVKQRIETQLEKFHELYQDTDDETKAEGDRE